jgi:predicted PurR-regulated permease PerM
MNLKLNAGWVCGVALVILTAWVLHGFVEALLAACVAAIASWPLYRRFAARLPRWVAGHAPVLFTCLMTLFVLTPMAAAFGALLTEADALARALAAADANGMSVPAWLGDVPLVGQWLAAHLSRAERLSILTQLAEPKALLGWAQSLGQFTLHHALIVAFTILLLVFLYRDGAALARQFTLLLRHRLGERADAYVDVGTQAVRAAVNSMLVVGLFNGFATAIAYVLAGVPHGVAWGAMTGALAVVPFVGYLAVAGLTLKLAVTGAATTAVLALAWGSFVLFCGDKIVRPMVARDGTRLPFVWVLMGCLGGFEALGLVGVVVGPVLLSLARELWMQGARGQPGGALTTSKPAALAKSRGTT